MNSEKEKLIEEMRQWQQQNYDNAMNFIERMNELMYSKKETCPICGEQAVLNNCFDIGDAWGDAPVATCGKCPIELKIAYADAWRKERQERLKGTETVAEYYDRQRRERQK